MVFTKSYNQVLNNNADIIHLDSNLLYLRIDNESISFNQALDSLKEGKFNAHIINQPINFGYDPSDFWFYTKFDINETADKVLNLPYPYYQYIDLYINKGVGWKKHSSGNLKLFNTRGTFQPENFAWPFNFEADSHVQVLINIRSRAPVIVSLELQTIEGYVNSSNTKNLLYGLFFGILIIMVLYNLFVYLIVKDNAYLYYVLLVLTNIGVFATVSGYAFHYIHPSYPEINFYIREFLITFLIIPTSLFAISFLDLKKYSLLSFKVLNVMIGIGVLLSLAICFGFIFGFSSLIISFHAPLLLLIGVIVRIKGNKNANFFILAWTGYLLGGLAMTLRNGGFLSANFFTDHGAEIGATLDVFLLAFALAYRYKQIRNESSRLQRANLKLVEEQNVQLEQKVNERTQILNSTLEFVQKQYNELNHENLAINSSMNYALKIQEAIFPKRNKMISDFKDVVMFFKPKQTVSGDFVFFETIDEFTFVAVVDCTGHGVPGALMSMAGYNLFYDAVNVQNLKNPSEILTYVEKDLNLRLQQNDQIVKDGMEVALCVINRQSRKVKFCGAQRPLLITIPNKEPQLIKGTKKAIGGHFQNVETSFIDHEFDLEEYTTLYLFSDGFQDQFGGESDKKYLSKNLVKLLNKTSTNEGHIQELLLEKEFDNWRENRDQVDDVIILGLAT